MLERASLMATRGGREGALDTARRALSLVSEGDWPVQRVYAHLRLADLLLPDVTEVERHLLAASHLAERLALPQLRYRLNERLGRLKRLQGRDEEARTLLEAAVAEIERLRGTVTQDAMRASFLRDKVAPYEELLQLYIARMLRKACGAPSRCRAGKVPCPGGFGQRRHREGACCLA
jgi:hypothetical protein